MGTALGLRLAVASRILWTAWSAVTSISTQGSKQIYLGRCMVTVLLLHHQSSLYTCTSTQGERCWPDQEVMSGVSWGWAAGGLNMTGWERGVQYRSLASEKNYSYVHEELVLSKCMRYPAMQLWPVLLTVNIWQTNHGYSSDENGRWQLIWPENREEVKTHHHHHCQAQIQSPKPKKDEPGMNKCL